MRCDPKEVSFSRVILILWLFVPDEILLTRHRFNNNPQYPEVKITGTYRHFILQS